MASTQKSEMTTNNSIEYYTSYRVKGILKLEYIDKVRRFCKTYNWFSDCEEGDNQQGDVPGCIKQWKSFLDNIKRSSNQHSADGVPIGLPSPWWGSECIVYEGTREDSEDMVHWWSFSGELKNTHSQLQYFLHHVVCEMCSEIPLCWTCKETDSLFKEHTEHEIRRDVNFAT